MHLPARFWLIVYKPLGFLADIFDTAENWAFGKWYTASHREDNES